VDHESITFTFAVDLFLLFVIGVGPKIALVPFLEITADMDDATKRRVARKMLTTAATVSVLLLVLGEVLRRLLHFSIGSLSVASGLILLIIAVVMLLGSGDPEKLHHRLEGQDPMRLAVFPLAIPYLVNPAGIVALLTVSAEAASVSVFALAAGLVALVLALDAVVFRWANRISDHLDEGRMLVTEKVFGFLLAALAVQLVLNGLDDVGVIHLSGH
jgi:MarC family membrane protein